MIATTIAMITEAEQETQLDIKETMVRGIYHQVTLATGEERGIRTGTGETRGVPAGSDLCFLVRIEDPLVQVPQRQLLLHRRLRRTRRPTMIQTLTPRL
jgi:hypothetical protein